jgi:TP901 family phage tail tape measure protein
MAYDITGIVDSNEINNIKNLAKGFNEATDALIKFLKAQSEYKKTVDNTSSSTDEVNKKRKQYTKTIEEATESEKKLAAMAKVLDSQQQSLLITEAKLSVSTSKTSKELIKKKLALQESNKEIKKEIANEGLAETSLVRMRQKLSKLTEAYDKSAVRTKEAAKEINNLSKEIEKEEEATNRHQRGIGNYRGKLEELKVGVMNGTTSFSEFGKGIASVGKSMLTFFMSPAGMIIGAIAGIVIAGKALIENAQEFDKAASSLSAITGATGDDLDFMKDKAIEFSKSSTESATDILGAFEKVGSAIPALLKNKELLTSVTKDAITLSEATGGKLSVEDAALATSAALQNFQIPLTESTRAINALAAGSLEGSSEIGDLAESFKTGGAVMKNSGLGLEDSIAALETLSNMSGGLIKGSEAGTQMKSMLLNLKQAGKGFESGQFNMRDALLQVNKELEAIQDPYKKAIYEQETFGSYGIVAGTILRNNVDEFDRLGKAVTGTNTAYKQAEVQMNNLEGSYALLSNAWKGFMLETEDGGGVVMGVWRAIVDTGTELLNWVSSLTHTSDEASKKIGDNTNSIGFIFATLRTGIKAALIPLLEAWNVAKAIVETIVSVGTGNLQNIPSIFKNFAEKAKDIVKDAATSTIKDFKKQKEKMEEPITPEIDNSQAEKGLDDLTKKTETEADKQANAKKEALNKTIKDLDEWKKTESKAIEDLASDGTKTKKEAKQAQLKLDVDYLTKRLDAEKKAGEDTKKTEATLIAAQKAYRKSTAEDRKKEEKAEEKAADKAAEDKKKLEDAKANSAISAAENEFKRKKMLIDENYANDVAVIKASIMSEEEKNKALLDLDKKRAADIEQLDEDKVKSNIASLEKQLENTKLTEVEQLKIKDDIEKEKMSLDELVSKNKIKLTEEETAANEKAAEAKKKTAQATADFLFAQAQTEANRQDLLLRATSKTDAEYNKKKRQLAITTAKNNIKLLEDQLSISGLNADQELDIKTKLEKAKQDLDNATFDEGQANDEKRKEDLEAIKDATIDIANQLFDYKAAKIDGELELLENKNDAGLISDEEYAKQKAKLEYEAAKNERDQALFSIAINTAMAVSKIWAEVPKADFGISTAILIGLALASGALQTATVLANPLPEYAEGTFSAASEFIAGEEGRELMRTKDGKFQIVDKKTHFKGESFKGAQIWNNEDTEEIMSYTKHDGFYGFNDTRIIDKLTDMERAIINKPSVVFDNEAKMVMGYVRNGFREKRINRYSQHVSNR